MSVARKEKGERRQKVSTAEEREYYSFNKRAYSLFAPFYDWVVAPFKGFRPVVARAIEISPKTKVLDVATGTGQQAFAFAALGAEVIGIDHSKSMLKIARSKNHFKNLHLIEGDGADLPFDDGTFDVACVSFALHEMPRSIEDRVLREMRRVTKPGGAVLIVDYGLPSNRVGSFLTYQVVKLYERQTYADFIRLDMPGFLAGLGLKVVAERTFLGGVARFIISRREHQSHLNPVSEIERHGHAS